MMKRLSSSDSVGGLISLWTSSTDEQSPRRRGREFQSMLEGYEEEEEAMIEKRGQTGLAEKKRRLSINQVKALEKNFELENKLEPERKVKLAKELQLQPRQVAVWFQNRRARWKTKQLEKDYGILKTQYDSLRHNFDSLRRDYESLLQEISKLKSKLNGGEEEEENNAKITESGISVKKEETSMPPSPPELLEHFDTLSYRSFSDSSGVFNEENSSNGTVAPVTVNSSGNIFQLAKIEQMEDLNDFLSGFFSDEQPSSLHWT